MFCLLPSSSHSPDKVFVRDAFSAREVSSCDLRVNFNTRINRDQVFYTYAEALAMSGQLYSDNGKDNAPGRS